ncbi:response regulator [Halofilum ochraceum]|uniref:response regulator n=1 Tax=Halofilum ochraceum TaxID=1611323 RepID=UPI0008DACE3C|nr:response regulator [Halofilum ochraceum]
MKNWSIQRRVLLIALLPAALLAVVLSVYNAYQQIQVAERHALEHARAVAAKIGPVAAHVVMAADDGALLEGLTNSLITGRTSIAGITIRDQGGNVLLHAPPDETVEANTGDDAVRITHPIGSPSSASSPPGIAGNSDAPLGSVDITVDLAQARQEQIGPLLEGLALAVIALGITALVAVRIGRSVTDPVHELVRGIERIREGDYDYRPRVASGGELGQLERGVRELTVGIEGTKRSLNERIEEATSELQATLAKLEERNAELESARREAEAASEFKSRFLANISHEIRTPMNSILGFTELLGRADLDPVYADYLVTIQSSAQSLLSLLNGILDLSKIESGHMELEYADTDVNELLFETFNLLAPQAFAKGVEFVVKPAPRRHSAVRVDAVRLNQVLINLASNAVKFTDQGLVQIGAHAVSRADGGVALTFSFRDTGRGIPHEAQARLFQAFAQGEDVCGEQRPRATGTGLGLHIASEIVFLMDGLIEFRSEPGAGSEFWFTLELEQAHTALGRNERGPRRRVALVIDGDPDFIATHVDILAMAGIDADPVATDRPTSDWPDMAALDATLVHIPARDIHDGKMTLPASIPSSDIPVFAYIYAEDPEIHRRLLDEGFGHVVQKTPDPRVLRDALERALDQPGHEGARPPWSDHAGLGSNGSPPAKVLVVDDQPVNLKLLESFLEGTGWETVAATGSDEALYHARLTRFDAILMDIHLPERDGIETSAMLRTPGELNAHTPILAITADAFADQAHAAMAAGMNDVLVKPVSRATLLERLSQWCHAGEHESGATEFDEKDGARAATPPPYYDPEDARTRAGGRSGVADELFTMLCQHLPSSRAALRSALDRGDPQALLTAAHRLKGAAAYCGVPRLRHDIANLEDRVRNGDDPTQAVNTVCDTIDVLQKMGENGATEPHSSNP